ncbi:DegT/DnrJ/EryC1/StrS family aminotransferase [Tamaricihabitans halophyticus]|uniref:DegT/DnrJ/EryC1/StrS family aminotransferase n=1 Tax=Tamaricihabitans halophyticus TaxID=1262583 RepID=UPI0014043737|nr:DegT/DnrJ/EryC1/StrS family aminotransferase [Tamaricihabitans halophyticus]
MTTFTVPYSGISNRLGEAEARALTEVLNQDTLAMGPVSRRFEEAFADYLGAGHVQATNSCTTALFLAAQVLDLNEGDEVITTPQTFWVTPWPLQARGVRIRFADIDPDSLNIDPGAIEALITERTRSIWVVHHGGQAVDMDPVMDIARRHGLTVLEDCAHAPGATYKGRKVGTIGDIGCFSFHSLKNMTTGEGGAFVTRHADLAEKARALGTIHTWGPMAPRSSSRIGPHPRPAYYRDAHTRSAFEYDFTGGYEIGNNYRMSEIAAALGVVQLSKLDQLNARRQEIAQTLDGGLQDIPGISVQRHRPESPHIHHLYTLFYDPAEVGAPKDAFIELMQETEGIEIVLRYFPLHLLPEFRALGHQYGECPAAERTYFDHQVQLPIYTHLTDAQIIHMIEALQRSVATLQRRGARS